MAPPFSSTRKLINQFSPLNFRRTASIVKRSIQKRTMKRTTSTQSFGSGKAGGGDVTNSQDKTITLDNKASTSKRIKTDDEDNQIKQWLSPLEPRHKHQSVQTGRVDGVGSWILETKEFREWSGRKRMPKKTVLFYYGHPGVGKTHIR